LRLLPAILTALLFVGCSGGAQDQGPPEEPLLPGGYKAVLDVGRSDPGQFNVTEAADGVRFTTGPAGVAWRPQDVIGPGDMRVEATLRLYLAPVAYRESYGIFVGGRNLDTPDQSYTYLMVRPTGDFTIRTRKGGVTEALVEWMPHEAVQRVNLDGEEPVNTLVIQVRGTDVDFLINGTRVFGMDAAEMDAQGVAGVRINHRLDVGLTAWSLSPRPEAAPDSTSRP
jgi:hypothetical protein